MPLVKLGGAASVTAVRAAMFSVPALHPVRLTFWASAPQIVRSQPSPLTPFSASRYPDSIKKPVRLEFIGADDDPPQSEGQSLYLSP